MADSPFRTDTELGRTLLAALACPICRGGLTPSSRSASLECDRAHSFDVARQGYVSLLGGGKRASTGDGAAMVAARADFLAAGHYRPIAQALAERATSVERRVWSGSGPRPTTPGLVVDVACGTGYYLAAVLEAAALEARHRSAGDETSAAVSSVGEEPGAGVPGPFSSEPTVPTHPMPPGTAGGGPRTLVGLGLDLSPLAARRAARAHPLAAAATADAWQRFPLIDGAAEILLSVFGPRNGAEMLRVLAPGGRLFTVTPAANHLIELRDRLGMIGVADRKIARLDARLTGLTRSSTDPLEYLVEMTPAEVENEVLMGPSAHHVDRESLRAAIADFPPLTTVTVSVEISTFERSSE